MVLGKYLLSQLGYILEDCILYKKEKGDEIATRCNVLDLSDADIEITEIHASLFLSTINLTKVILPDSLLRIGFGSFKNCSKLEEVIFNKNISCIRSEAFMNCNLKTVILPESMEQIGSYAFSGNKIKNLKLNEWLLSIDEFAFSGNNIDEIFIPSTVEDFFTSCFANQNNRVSVLPSAPFETSKIYLPKHLYTDFKECLEKKGFKILENNLENILKDVTNFKDMNNIYKNIKTKDLEK